MSDKDKLVERAMQQSLIVAQRTTAKHLSPLSHDMKKLADITLELAAALKASECECERLRGEVKRLNVYANNCIPRCYDEHKGG